MNFITRKLRATLILSMALYFAFIALAEAKTQPAIPEINSGYTASYGRKTVVKKRYNSHKTRNVAQGIDSKKFFTLNVKNGEKLGNIFSRAISYKSKTDSFTEAVSRVSGTAVYTVLDNSPVKPGFEISYRYDGRPDGNGKVEISDDGKTNTFNGKSSINTDGSGLLYNSFIWGTAPDKIKSGDTWTVMIPQEWELGGAGKQTVTVMDMDEKHNTVTLKREGTSEGFYDNDTKQIGITKNGKTIKADITPGQSHWVGYTIFKNGLVISDELLVTRPVTLTSEGSKFEASEREYFLLNAMPVI